MRPKAPSINQKPRVTSENVGALSSPLPFLLILLTPLPRTRAALVHERQRSWTAHVTGLDPLEPKAGAFDQRSDRAIEVTTAAKTLPGWIETVLPPTHVRIGGTAVFDEEKTPAGLEHTAHFAERPWSIRNAAQCPRRDYRVDAPVLQRNRFGGTLDEFNRTHRWARGLAGHRQQPWRGVETDHLVRLPRIEG